MAKGKISMKGIVILAVIFLVWFSLQKFILPRFGVST